MKEVHSIVLNVLKNVDKKGLLLDAAGGNGLFAAKLKEAGYNVILCDLYRPLTIYASFVQADLNLFLPFKSGKFNIITCMESLQYLENHKQLFREFKRVLQENGRLVITIPNTLGLGSRLFFLQTGYFKHFKPFREIKESREWDKVVYSPVSFVEIFQLLTSNCFEIELLTASKYSYREWPLFLIYRCGYSLLFWLRRDKRENKLLKFLYSKEILLGDHIVVVARR